MFGLSVLHSRIWFFETILHVAYKVPINQWQAKIGEQKDIVKETKNKFKRASGKRWDY